MDDNGSTSSITSSITSSGVPSRKGSRASLLAQLLSPSPPSVPIPCPQSQGIATSASSLYSQSPPFHSLPTHRRHSFQDQNQPLPTQTHSAHNRQHRYTLPELFPRGNHLLEHTPNVHSQLPSFPINMQPREGSPTKIYGTSPSSSIGRRSPIHEVQMDSIAEDCTEDVAENSEETAYLCTFPPSPNQPAVPTSSEERRQRKMGVIHHSTQQAKIAASLDQKLPGNVETSSIPHKHLFTALQMPLYSQPEQPLIHMQTCSTNAHGNFYTTAALTKNHYNHYGAVYRPPVVPQTHFPDVLAHVSSVLTMSGIPYQHSNGIFAIEHRGVKLQILVGCLPHLAAPSAIKLQYIAGDAHTYQALCTQLASRLQFAAQ